MQIIQEISVFSFELNFKILSNIYDSLLIILLSLNVFINTFAINTNPVLNHPSCKSFLQKLYSIEQFCKLLRKQK